MSAQHSMTSEAKPFLKVTGGKRRLLHHFQGLVPSEWGTYHEPFLGGGALFFDLRPKRAVLGDANAALVNTYRAVRDNVERVIRSLGDYENDRATFERVRGVSFRYGDQLSWDAQFFIARDYIFLNKTCFNGLHRVNQSGQFNVPYGRYANPLICDEPTLRAASQALQGVPVLAESFENLLTRGCARPKAGDLVYLDPPYMPMGVESFTAYTAGGFTMNDQLRLRDVATWLRARGVTVILSNSASPLVRELYEGWRFREIESQRSVGASAASRGKARELLIY